MDPATVEKSVGKEHEPRLSRVVRFPVSKDSRPESTIFVNGGSKSRNVDCAYVAQKQRRLDQDVNPDQANDGQVKARRASCWIDAI